LRGRLQRESSSAAAAHDSLEIAFFFGALIRPVNRALLIKHRDVFDRAPDPKNYRFMLLRCGGDIPLNICATISGLFSTDLGFDAQQSLETELLTDSLKSKVARFRQAKIGPQQSLIFTRANALLNLKCLLATRRPQRYSATAVGAIALHANDYLDIDLPTADPTLLMVQILPVWEIYNPRDVGALLRRYHYIFHEILSTDKHIVELFAQELATTPDDLRVDGLKIDDYLALLFGLYTIASNSAKSLKTSIIDFSDPKSALDISADDAGVFLKARSIDQNAIAAAIGPLLSDEAFAAAMRTAGWATDFSMFRTHPLLALSDGRLLVTDLQFLIENAAAGLFWNTFYRLPTKRGRQLLLGYWGDAFETYVRRLVAEHFTDDWTILTNVSESDFEIDVLIIRDDVAVVIECKAGTLNHAIKVSRNSAKVTRAIDTKLVSNEEGKPKGVGQLARSCKAVARGELASVSAIRRVYPLLVVDDPAFSAPGTNTYLAERFAALGPHHSAVSPPTIATIDEFEEIAPYIAAGDISWRELLERRFTAKGVDATPLHNTFTDVAQGRLRVRSNRLTAATGERLHRLIEEKYQKLAARADDKTS